MNNLAFQIYGTKKATSFQSVWDTRNTSPLGGELANRAASSVPTDWSGTNLLTGGYTHNGSGSNNLPFATSIPIVGQSYQMQYTITGTGSVIINFGGVSSAPLIAGTNVIITLTSINSTTLSITPVSFVGNISLSIKQSSSAANQIQLPITSIPVGKSIWIDWGDNSYTNANNANIIANRIHTYSAPGEYTVRILGDNFNFGFGNTFNTNDRLKIKSISSWGKLKIGGLSFYGCSYVTMSGITDIPDLTGVTSLGGTFSGCSAITTVGRMNEWNTSSVTNMSGMFGSCTNFNSDISNWNVSSVTGIADMFNGASKFNQPIGNWERVSSPDTSTLFYCTNLTSLFKGAAEFNQPIGNWKVDNVTLLSETFRYASKFNQDLSNWKVDKVTSFFITFENASSFNNGFASGVVNQLPWTINNAAASVNMDGMFASATAFNSNLGTGTTPWDVSKVTNFTNMFAVTSKFNNGDEDDITKSKITDWNIGGSVTSVSLAGMFGDALNFNRDISSWNVSKVNNMSDMFRNADAFNQPLANWERNTSGNVSTLANVTNMYNMFRGVLLFNQNIGNWNVSKVTTFAQMFQDTSAFNNGGSPDIGTWSINTTPGANVLMNGMFSTTSSFNQPLNGWNTSEVITMSSMFASSSFNNGLLSGVADTLAWSTGKVTTMAGMFSYNPAFNQNIGSWNVSNVTNMSSMFAYASAFNQPIGSWDVSKVTNMNSMFSSASNFNQPIGNWERVLSPNTSTMGNVTNMSNMFDHAIAFNQDISSWNVSGVITMYFMFYDANAFNQPLANWERIGSTLANVANMQTMFQGADLFNQPIGNWNVSNVTTMQAMFNYASAFNQPIGSWNVSKVTNMLSMFLGATAFNQNIGSWNVSNVTNFSNFMGSATFSSTNLDAIYNGWIVNGVKPNISSPLSTNISFGTAKYSQTGKPGKDTLLANPNNWRILDGLLSVSSISNNGGLIRVATVTAHGFVTGNSVYIYGVLGTTNANGTWTVTKINDSIIELQGSNYNGTYISNSGNVIIG